MNTKPTISALLIRTCKFCSLVDVLLMYLHNNDYISYNKYYITPTDLINNKLSEEMSFDFPTIYLVRSDGFILLNTLTLLNCSIEYQKSLDNHPFIPYTFNKFIKKIYDVKEF